MGQEEEETQPENQGGAKFQVKSSEEESVGGLDFLSNDSLGDIWWF